jgi:hypothetical protein
MARSRSSVEEMTVAGRVIDAPESTLLDLLDNLLNKGVVANGDVTLGVAGIDLIYVRLSALLCAADRVLPPPDPASISSPRRRHRTAPSVKKRT